MDTLEGLSMGGRRRTLRGSGTWARIRALLACVLTVPAFLATAAAALALAQEFIESLDAPRTTADARAIYQEVFRRLLNTDMSGLSPEEQIAITKGALVAVEPYMVKEWNRGFPAFLDRGGQHYPVAYATGETTKSFPLYLKEIGYATTL